MNRSRLESFLAKNYKLGKLYSFKQMKKGFGNELYHLKTLKGDYVLKKVVRNNPYRVNYEVNFLNHLKSLPVPKLIKNNKNSYLSDMGKNKVLIYPYLPGGQKSKFSKEMLGQIGRFLGKLHLQTKNFLPKTTRLEFYNLTSRQIDQQYKIGLRARNPKIKRALRYIRKEINSYLLPNNLPKGATHIDLKPENTLFVGEKLTGVVDFDNSYNGPLLLDLAKTIMWFACQRSKFDWQAAQIIYEEYNRTRKLTHLEKQNLYRALHYAILSHTLVDVRYYAEKKLGLPEKYILWQIRNLISNDSRITEDTFRKTLLN